MAQPRWIAPLFALAALVLVPWTLLLAKQLPSSHAARHWDVTWVGFDLALTVLMIAVAVAAWRRSPWLEGAAAAAAALLVMDAWFDVTTASAGLDLRVAIQRRRWSYCRSPSSACYSRATRSACCIAGSARRRPQSSRRSTSAAPLKRPPARRASFRFDL
jgi:hypothetical protein